MDDFKDLITKLQLLDENYSKEPLKVILNELLLLADMKNMEIIKGKIALKLWFRCWEYCKI